MNDRIKISFKRLWQIIFQPCKVWEGLEEEPVILLPLIIITSLNLLVVCMIMPEALSYSMNVLTRQGMAPDLIKQSLKVFKISMVMGALFIPFFTWMVHAALLAVFNHMLMVQAKLSELFRTGSYLWWLVFIFESIKNALTLGKDGIFKRFLAVAVYAWIPVFVGNMLEKILIMLRVLDYEKTLSLWTSAAILLPSDKNSGFLFILLNNIDIFTIWGLGLLVAGGAAIMKKQTKELAVYIFILWFIYIVFKAVIKSSLT
ncbi:MAG: YIP1 family protein [Syntrophomonadaceae bacterium]|nr:YIP1 family protein [Syntrophomonadaceae bacterium]